MYCGYRIVNPLPHGRIYQLEYSVYVQFLFPLVLQSPLIASYLSQPTFPLIPAVRFFFSYVCNIVSLFCHIVYSTLESFDLLNDFFFPHLHTLRLFRCRVQWVLTNAYCQAPTITVSNRMASPPLSSVFHLFSLLHPDSNSKND